MSKLLIICSLIICSNAFAQKLPHLVSNSSLSSVDCKSLIQKIHDAKLRLNKLSDILKDPNIKSELKAKLEFEQSNLQNSFSQLQADYNKFCK